MRRHATVSEALFESRLKEKQVEHKRQMIFGVYILDFCIPDKLINIEIDGSSHRRWYDDLRDAFVKDCGFHVIRIPNDKVPIFDLSILDCHPSCDLSRFRSALAKANSKRGAILKREKLC